MALQMQQPQPPDGLQQGQKNDPNLNPVGPYLHGQNGLLNIQGASDGVFSAMIMPKGIIAHIPVVQSDPFDGDSSNGQFGGEDAALDSLITGVTGGAADEFENQPTTDCADGPIAGLTKVCTIVNTFGRYRQGVREVSQYRAGRRESLADPLTLRLLNSPQMQQILSHPSNTPSMQQSLSNEIASRMWQSAIAFQRMFYPRLWIGSPANNVGERRDIVGLDTHINENNKVDWRSSAICTAANSVMLDFDYELLNAPGGRDIVEYFEVATYNAVEWNASRMGLDPVSGIIAMRPEVWRYLSEVWPVRQYQSQMAQMAQFAASGGQLNVVASQALMDRNAFRSAHMLPINGRNYMVVEDDTIPFETPNETARLQPGQYASDVYFVPMTVLGSVPATYFQFFNHNNAQATGGGLISMLANGSLTFTTDGGLFRWYVNFKNGCINMTYEMSPRLKMKTPMVAWRIQNVTVQPTLMPRSWDPDSDYFADGGVTEQPSDTFYTPWSPTTPTSL